MEDSWNISENIEWDESSGIRYRKKGGGGGGGEKWRKEVYYLMWRPATFLYDGCNFEYYPIICSNIKEEDRDRSTESFFLSQNSIRSIMCGTSDHSCSKMKERHRSISWNTIPMVSTLSLIWFFFHSQTHIRRSYPTLGYFFFLKKRKS